MLMREEGLTDDVNFHLLHQDHQDMQRGEGGICSLTFSHSFMCDTTYSSICCNSFYHQKSVDDMNDDSWMSWNQIRSKINGGKKKRRERRKEKELRNSLILTSSFLLMTDHLKDSRSNNFSAVFSSLTFPLVSLSPSFTLLILKKIHLPLTLRT